MHRARILILAIAAALAFGSLSHAAEPQSGREIYAVACAACHGMDGRGAPEGAALNVEPANLTDCNFAMREPDADWLAVAHDGGPARAFAREMPAFGDALDRTQLLRALEHARSFCGNPAWPRGDLNFPRALATEKAFPEDELVLTTAAALEGDGSITNKLIYEQRFGPRSQFEVIVPFGWEERVRPGGQAPWAGGVGDIAVGIKHVVFHDLKRGTIFSAAGEVKAPTGSERRGFGGGRTVLEPFLAFGQRLPRRSFLHVQGGAEIPLESDAVNDAFLRLASGKTFTPTPRGRAWTPIVELLGSVELESGSSVHWDALPQIQFSISRRQHVLGAAGIRFPVNDRDAKDPQLVIYLLWDWYDGGLGDGW